MKVFKNKIRFSFGITIFLIAAVLSAISFFSCEVGLGGAVDIQPPALSITSPGVDSVIRDNFILEGTCSDDGKIASITATLTPTVARANTRKVIITEYDITYDAKDRGAGVWTIPVDTLRSDGKKLIADGSYQVTIAVKDGSGRTTTQSTTLTIDNTPPIIVLQRPGTDINADNSDTYGQLLSIQGQGADDNNIDHIDVTVYDNKNGPDVSTVTKTITLSNVPGSINHDLAKYTDPDQTKYADLIQNYKDIYGDLSPDEFVAKQFYCTIKAYDSAKRYPKAGEEAADDALGNFTDVYYLYEDISLAVLKNYKINEVYKIQADANLLDAGRAAETDSVLDELDKAEFKKTAGSFILDPKNNPTFSVAGRPTIGEGDCLQNPEYNVQNDNDITIQVNVGLDNSPIVDDETLKVYFQKCNYNSTTGKYELEGPKIYPNIDPVNGKKKSGSNYQFTVSVKSSDGLIVEKTYMVGVEGHDDNGQQILPANHGYGFYLVSTASAPTLKDINPAASTLYVKKDASRTIGGKTVLTEGKPVVSIIYDNGTSEEVWATTGELDSTALVSGTTNEYNFTLTIPAEKFNTSANKKEGTNEPASTEFGIEIRTANGTKSSSTYKTVYYDVDPAKVTDLTVSPEIKNGETYVLNGQLTFKALLEDDFTAVDEWHYEVWQDDVKKAYSTPRKSSKVEFDYNTTHDTTGLDDTKGATVKIIVKDKAGNLYTKEIPCYVDQSTDEPGFGASDGLSWDSDILNPCYIKSETNNPDKKNIISGSLYSKLNDDDGLKFVKIKVQSIIPKADNILTDEQKKDKTYRAFDIVNPTLNPELDKVDDDLKEGKIYPKSGIENSLTQSMPTSSGFYLVTQTVYDKNFICTGTNNGNGNEPTEDDETNEDNKHFFTQKEYVIKISGNGPQFSLERDTSYISPNNLTKELNVTISIEDGEAPYTIKRVYKDNTGVAKTDVIATDFSGTQKVDAFAVSKILAAGDTNDTVSVRYIVSDVNGETPKEIKYSKDSDKPEFKNPKIEAESSVFTVYKKDNKFYLHNDGQTFTISGLAEDHTTSVDKVKVEITNTKVNNLGGTGTKIEKESDTGYFSDLRFANGDSTAGYTYWQGGAQVKITVTDIAGNTSDPITMDIVFDNEAPVPEHKIDDSHKNLLFRIGDAANDAGQPDVGGKYSDGTYGNATTIQIRGLFEDNTGGSGVNKFYYRVFNNQEVEINPTEAPGDEPVEGTGVNAGKIFFNSKEILKNYIINNKTDTFSPLDDNEKKNVEYNVGKTRGNAFPENERETYVTLTNNDNFFGGAPVHEKSGNKYWVNKKGYVQFRAENVKTNFKTSIKGFKEGKNYLVLVMEDNVGNTVLDCATVNGTEYPCYSLNVDLKIPTIPSKENDRIYTNIASNATSGQVKISGTISDQPTLVNGVPVPDGSSGIKSIVFTSDANEQKVEISISSDDNAAALAAKGLERIPTATDPTLMSWNVDVKTLLPITDGSATIMAKVTDNSGYETSVPVANITVDVTAPIITVNSPVDGDFTTTSIEFTGTANDGSGAGIDKTEGLTLYYKTASSGWTAYTTKPTLIGQNWTCTFDASTVAAQDANTTLSFRVGAKDQAGSGNQGYSDTLTVTIDRVKPELADGCTIDNKAIGNVDTSSWFKASTLNIKGSFSDEGGSGAKTIKYQVKPGNKTALAEKSVPSKDGGFDINVSGFENGTNTLWIWAVDDVGNESVKGTGYTIQVDSQAPTFTQHEDTTNYGFAKVHLTNAKAPKTLKFYVTESKAESGIVGISAFNITIGGEQITPVTGTGGSTIGNPDSNGKRLVELVIGESDLANISGYQTVLATVSDKAGNVSNPQAIGILNKDGDPPAVTFTSPAADSVVNKTITVTGKATDANEVTEINLTAKCGTNEQSYTYTKDAPSTISYANSIWSVNIDTTQLDNTFWTDDANKKTVTLSITAKDKAGNTTETPVEQKLVIKQNEDRPVITIGSGVDFTKKNNNEIWVKGSSTIYGSVNDDDGISTFKVYKKGSKDSDFSDANASYSGGSWNVKLPKDDSYTLRFEVKDRPSVGTATTFTSAAITSTSTDAAILATPIIEDSPEATEQNPNPTSNKFGDTKENGNTLIPICLDTTNPSLIINAISLDNSTWYEDINKSDLYLGGDNGTLYIKVTASDSSGLYGTTDTSGITAEFTGTMTLGEDEYELQCPDNACTVAKGSGDNEFIITVTNFGTAKKETTEKPFSGTMTLTVTAKDKAEMETQKSLSRTVDNAAPVLKISAPDSVSSTAVVSGTVEGEVVNPKIYFAVTKAAATGQLPSSLQPAKDSNLWKQDKFASLAYNIYFDGTTSDTTTHTDLFRQYLVTTGCTTSDAINNNTYIDLTPVYVWIKAEDVCGNISYDYATVVVDPQGNRPNVVVSYPNENGVKLGGTIRLMGTANDNVEAKYVWIKIDTNNDGQWKLADYNTLKAATHSGYTFGQISTNKKLGTGQGEVNITPSDSNIDDIAIMVKVTGGSWNQNINADGELIPSGEKNNTVKMWVSATDDDNGNGTSILESSPVARTFIVDKDNPYFVQDSLKLITDSGSEQAYKEGMSVKGEWWLVGTINDDVPGIRTISIKEGGSDTDTPYITTSGQEITEGNYQFTKVANGSYWNYNFKIKVGATTGTGERAFRITATENKDSNALQSYKDFIIRYDNLPPTVASHTSESFKIESTVKNSQGYYSLSSAAYEANDGDTGVDRIAVYFTRTVDGTTYVFDPMYKRTNAASKLTTVTSGTGIKQDSAPGGDMLYWGSAEVSSVSNSTLTLAAAAPSYVHVGGLAKIKGVIYRIASVSGTTVVLSGEPGTSETVEFAVANVVDNTTAESKKDGAVALKTDYGYGYCNDYIYDDGDMIMENLHKDDSKSWTWELYVNSKNIPDGDVDIHYVVFDKAGNFKHDVVTGASVENNKPRLVSVALGVDINQDGNITQGDNEITNYYPEGLTEKPGVYTNASTAINISGITVKGKMSVTPEIVGGNGDLFYQWKTKKTTEWQKVQGPGKELMSGNDDYDDADFNNANDYIASGTTVLTTQTGTISHDIDWLIKYSTDNDTDFNINYEIFDSTDGKTVFTDSNKVSINITGINLQVRDKVAPTVTIDDFYWNSLTDNSVYTSKAASQVKSVADLEGHIELHGDLPSATFNATAGATNAEFDTDDKVSGKIKLKGTVQDNIVLTDLYLTIDGLLTTTKVATYDKTNGKWKNAANTADFTKVGTLDGAGYEFDIDTASNAFDLNTGHSVNWTLLWDTSKIGDVAQNNIKVQVRADDNASAAGHEDDSNNPANFSTTSTRQVDVVPYITKIDTGLNGAYTSKPSVFNRSANGSYSVRRGESITITGFNLKKGTTAPTVTIPVTATTTITPSASSKTSITVAIPNTAKSGELSVTVNGVQTLNNKTAKSITTGTGENAVTRIVEYNTEPNGINNDILTDIRKLSVWKFNTVVTDNSVRYSTMRVGKDANQTVGFAYDSGAQAIRMNQGGSDYLIDWSFTQWYATSVAVDNAGRMYGSGMNGDSGGTGNQSWGEGGYANYGFYAWNTSDYPGYIRDGGAFTYSAPGSGRYKNYQAYNSGRKKVALENSSADSDGNNFNANRILNPKIVTTSGTGTDSTGYVYTVYYDSIFDRLVFRYGTVSGTLNSNTSTLSFSDGLGNHGNTNNGSAGTMQIIAGAGATGTNKIDGGTAVANTNRAGEYVAVGVIPKANISTANDAVDGAVVAWYDASNQRLLFSYNKTPNDTSKADNWGNNTQIIDSDFAGWYVDMVVDPEGGVHIAYYGASNGDLKYAYLPIAKDAEGNLYTQGAQVCTVDSYLSVGTNISIDVPTAKENVYKADGTTTTRYVPRISYFMSAFTKTKFSVRTAYLYKLGEGDVIADGVESDKFTGNWEVMTIPTDQIPLDYTIGVGIKKNDSNTNATLLGYGTKTGLQTAALQ